MLYLKNSKYVLGIKYHLFGEVFPPILGLFTPLSIHILMIKQA